ncbi:hypothetical protein ACQ4PT_045045 [Festuca glaucescens]
MARARRRHPVTSQPSRSCSTVTNSELITSSGKNGTEPSDTVPTTLGSALGTLQYVITVGIGSPVVIQTMMIDTANDVSWVYCRSSNGSTLFDPSKSTTYAPFSCSAPECTQLGTRGNGCANSECQYNVDYAAVANSTGTYGSDTLTLTSSETVTSFQFGCRENEGVVAAKTDGLMGLGGDTQSLVLPTAATYGQAFSYCFPPTNASSGFLTLVAPSSMAGFVSTPMFRWGAAPTFYGVLLQDIAVDGKLLNIPPSVFSDRSVMSAGTIISRLPPAAYAALWTAFKAGMTHGCATQEHTGHLLRLHRAGQHHDAEHYAVITSSSMDGPSIAELLRRDKLRAEYVERKFNSDGNDDPDQSAVQLNPWIRWST